MPIYEYQCHECEIKFEEMHRITDRDLPNCPSCGSAEVTKLISLSAFHLKGSGWYVTDYGGKKTDPRASSENGNGDGSKSAAPEDGEKKASEPATNGNAEKPSAPTNEEKKSAASQSGPTAS
jgi:putative FmdB family regulatory protein